MAGLHIYRSNRLETLADALAEVTRSPLPSPFHDEVLMVQSLGMRRWLSFQLAERHGVTMNASFLFPARFVRRIFEAALPHTARVRAFDRALLPWRIFALLPFLFPRPEFNELAAYVRGEVGQLKEFQLAHKIAAVFDRYLAYRPEMLMEWQEGANSDWQAQLWRELLRGHEHGHGPALALQLRDVLRKGDFDGSKLPERVSIFGISSLPPFYIYLIGEIATCLDVHLFHLEPTALFWGDVRSSKEQERMRRKRRSAGRAGEPLDFEVGHPLLASMGRVGREFSNLLLELNPVRETELFRAPEARNLLTHVQRDIFELRERASSAKTRIPPEDRSIQVHCCHSPVRELEVLHDQLLAMFESDPSLTPKDILVGMPDIESYAPYIEAVFGSPESSAVAIPFTIADRSARAESCVADTFLQLLDLAGSRFGAASVLALLETRPVQRRFELAEIDVKAIRTWIERSGIRWGIDAAHRSEFGLPSFPQNTWRAGLHRLLLGYALSGDGETLFEGILPIREMEGELAITLGRFIDFAESIFAALQDFRHARTLREWEETFRRMLQTFFDENDESATEIRRLRAVFEALGQSEVEAPVQGAVSFEVVRAHLAQALTQSDAGIGFMAGRVTFCALKPMRSVPFKVVCLLGMNDSAFPRSEPALAFDLVAQHRKQGDRSLRDDDRQLFLETLLSARNVFYASYCGASNKDNSESPPSVVVSELLDYIETNFIPPSSLPHERWPVTRHPLQPFSARYFQPGSALFSYSVENCQASICGQHERGAAPNFLAVPLAEAGSEWWDLDLDRFAQFFCNPAKFFLRHRLGLRFAEETRLVEEREPMSIDGLTRFRLQARLAERIIEDGRGEDALAVFHAAGMLPVGYAGDAEFAALRRDVDSYVGRVRDALLQAPLASISVDLQLDAGHLSGVLRDIQPRARVCRRATAITPADQLRAWISHLVLQCVAPPDYPRHTLVIGTDATLDFAPVPGARECLQQLFDLYARGLRAPLPFFPRTSYEFARRALRPRIQESKNPLQAARTTWLHGETAESAEPEYLLCYRDASRSLDAEWEQVTLAIFTPLFQHLAS